MTKAEQETIIRWDQEEQVLHLYTSYAPGARNWLRLGYSVKVCDRSADGEPRGWQAQAPLEALRLRRLVDGAVQTKRRGRSFGAESRKLATVDDQSSEAHGIGSPEITGTSKYVN
jgi:hypothetical protein